MSDQADKVPEEDFTKEPLGPLEPPPPGGPATPTSPEGQLTYSPTLSSDVEKHREGTRRWLAYGLILLLGTIALLSLAAVAFKWQKTADIKSIVEVLFPPIVALTGSALGFFYGVERGSTP